MTFRQVCAVNNNQVIITLPVGFQHKQEVTVVIDDQVDVRSQKMTQLKAAITDPLFLADIKDVQADFDTIEHENL